MFYIGIICGRKKHNTEAITKYNMQYFDTSLKIVLSLLAIPTEARPIAIHWGLIIFPIPAPIIFAAANHAPLAPICCAVIICIGPKRTLVLVPLPVIKAPNTPISGEKNGNNIPV